jgi:hypothetical protein
MSVIMRMPDLNESGFEVLQAAVRAARNLQLKTVSALRSYLLSEFPDRASDIDSAIKYWSASVVRFGIAED